MSEMRVAIVGAGASGLTAARELAKLSAVGKVSYDVTIFEREGRVGGKVCSVSHGGRIHELGALYQDTVNYPLIYSMANELGVQYVKDRPSRLWMIDRTGQYSWSRLILRSGLAHRLPAELFRFWRLYRMYPEINEPTITKIAPELRLPLSELFERHRLKAIERLTSTVMASFGYGYFDEVPAIYLLKCLPWFLNPRAAMSLRGIDVTYFPEGWQSLWETVARTLNVQLDAEISRIERIRRGRDCEIRISCNGREHYFDRLIISCEPSSLLGRMDYTESERQLFAEVRTHRYLISLVEGTDLPHAMFPEHTMMRQSGRVMCIIHFHTDSPYYKTYQQLPPEMSLEQATDLMHQDVRRLGGSIRSVVTQRHWNYFPHVSTQSLDRGFYDRVEHLQGQHNTYYVGGLLNFESVEHTSRFAKNLVGRYFGVGKGAGIASSPSTLDQANLLA